MEFNGIQFEFNRIHRILCFIWGLSVLLMLQPALRGLRLQPAPNLSFPNHPLCLLSVLTHLHTYAINHGWSYSLYHSQTLFLNPSKYPPPKFRPSQTFPSYSRSIEISQSFLHKRRWINYLRIDHTIIRFPSRPARRRPLALFIPCHLQNSKSSVNISKTISARASSVILNPLVAHPFSSSKSLMALYVFASTTEA